MAKQKDTKKQKEKDKETGNTVKPSISEFVGKKLIDVSREDGETVLKFSNGYEMKLSGYIHFGVEITYE